MQVLIPFLCTNPARFFFPSSCTKSGTVFLSFLMYKFGTLCFSLLMYKIWHGLSFPPHVQIQHGFSFPPHVQIRHAPHVQNLAQFLFSSSCTNPARFVVSSCTNSARFLFPSLCTNPALPFFHKSLDQQIPFVLCFASSFTNALQSLYFSKKHSYQLGNKNNTTWYKRITKRRIYYFGKTFKFFSSSPWPYSPHCLFSSCLCQCQSNVPGRRRHL